MIKDLKKFFADCTKKAKFITLTYYCKASGGTFYVSSLDKNNDKIAKTHPATGVPVYYNNKQQFEEVLEYWDPIVTTRSSRADALALKSVTSDEDGNFTAYQKELIAKLEEMANDSSSQVSREDERKQEVNPQAYASEQKLKKLQDEMQNNVDAALEKGKLEGKKESLSKMGELNKQLTDAEKAISELTEPKKPEKKEVKK